MSIQPLFAGPRDGIPQPGVEYTRVLTDPTGSPLRPAFGVMLAMVGYAVMLPLVNQAVLSLAWLTRGRPDTFAAYYRQAMGYHLPEGMVAGHLTLALLIPLTIVVVRYVHGLGARWLCSVQPGMRWRYLTMSAVAALVLLNLVLWARGGLPAAFTPTDNLAMWLTLVLLTAPLQAAGEEFLFRGYLLQATGAMVGNRWVGVVVSALIFAFFHGTQNLPLFVDRFGFGLLAGALVLLTGGLEAAIGIHVVNNVLAFGYAALQGSLADARGIQQIGWGQAIWDLVAFGLCGVVAWALGRRLRVATTTPPDDRR